MLGLPRIMLGNADFVLLMKAQRTRKKTDLPKLFFVNYVWVSTSSQLQYFYLVKIKRSEDIFGSSMC